MENIISLTHASDIDGVSSAALIKMKYGVPDSNIFFADYSMKSLLSAGRGIRKALKPGTTLFITDIGINKGLAPEFIRIIKSVKGLNGSVVWFDHHFWEDSEIRNVAGGCDLAVIGENKRYCATEITYRELSVRGAFARRLSDTVHYSDFNIRPRERSKRRLIGIYALSIAYYNTLGVNKRRKGLLHIVDTLCKGKFFDGRMAADASFFERRNLERIAEMAKRLHYAGENIAVGFGPEMQSTQACASISEKSGRDISIYVNVKAGTCHLRSKKADCSIIARAFGGGGHPHACGFSIDKRKYGGFSEKKKEMLVSEIGKRSAALGI